MCYIGNGQVHVVFESEKFPLGLESWVYIQVWLFPEYRLLYVEVKGDSQIATEISEGFKQNQK